jgi:peptidoglycan/xylan/chitin deacetylase (PgdA/CDA1 family)
MPPIPILVYHSIGEDCAPAYRRWLVKPRELDRQLRTLSEHGYRPMTVGTLALLRRSGQPVPPRPCIITFDDGLRDFAKGAMPVLAARGFPATLYVVSGLVGATAQWLADLGEGERPMLDWRALRDLHGAGIEIGAHTVRHPELDTLPRARAAQEIEDSKRTLEDGLGAPVVSFAYPHGYASRTTRRIVEEAGYLAACRVRHALSDETENLFALSRIIVTSEETPEKLIALIEGQTLPVAPPPDRLIALGWRAARRMRAFHRSVYRGRWVGGAEGGG